MVFSVRRFSIYLFIIFSAMFIIACDTKSTGHVINLDDTVTDVQLKTPAQQQQRLLFDFDLRSSPQEDARQYLPFLDYLSRVTGYQFELRFTPRGERVADLLGQGKADLAAVGAVSYIRAHEKYNAKILVRGVNRENRADYQACMVVVPDSPLQKLEDLRGKSVAFGAMSSTQGHLIPRMMLQKKNILLSDLRSFEYLGSHQRCADAVISGRLEVCGMQDILARRLSKEGILRILACSKHYSSSGIALAPHVPDDVAEKIRKALLAFDPNGKNAQELYHWQRTEMANGFVRAEETDYLELRQAMIKFGMLDVVKRGN